MVRRQGKIILSTLAKVYHQAIIDIHEERITLYLFFVNSKRIGKKTTKNKAPRSPVSGISA